MPNSSSIVCCGNTVGKSSTPLALTLAVSSPTFVLATDDERLFAQAVVRFPRRTLAMMLPCIGSPDESEFSLRYGSMKIATKQLE